MQSDATSNDAMDVIWTDNVRHGTTEASEAQTLPPLPVPKSKQRPRRSGTKTTTTVPSTSGSYIRTRPQKTKAVPGSPIQGPPTPLSDTSPSFLSTSTLLPASKQGVPLDLAALIRAEVTAAMAPQLTGIHEKISTMGASIERLGQNGVDARLAEIEQREAALTAREEEYERLAALGARYREMEQELIERSATKERELVEKASRTPLQIEQVVQDQVEQDQVDISADQGADDMDLLIQEISIEEPTNCEVSIRQDELFKAVSQAESIVPFSALEAAESEEVSFQDVLMAAAAVETVENCLLADKVDQGLDLDGDGNDGWQISPAAAILVVNEDHETNPGPEMIHSTHGTVDPAEDQATPSSLPDGLTAMGCVIDPRVSEPTGPPTSDEDAEADVDGEAVEGTALATLPVSSD